MSHYHYKNYIYHRPCISKFVEKEAHRERIWDKKLKILSGGTGASNKHGHMWRHLWRGFINSSTYDGSGGGDYDDDLDHGGKNEDHVLSIQNNP